MAASQLAPITPIGASTSREASVAERVDAMCASALFAGLSPQECLKIASSASARKFARDELLFMQGQPVRNLVLIQTGSVKLTQLSPSGNEVIIWMNGESDAVGVDVESPSCNHTCSARAMEECRALTWEYSRVQSLLVEYPQMRKNINRILANKLQELEERFREVATEKVAKRLAMTLFRLLKCVGKESQEGIRISLSREELAQMVGTTLFTISRILSRWSDEGVVVPRREAVVVRDVKRLLTAGDEDY